LLYSLWLILAAIAAGTTVLGLARLLNDNETVDNSHVITFITGIPLNALVAVSSVKLDFICTGGAFCVNGIQSDTSEWWFVWVFFAFTMLNLLLTFVSAYKLIDINKNIQLPD